MSVEKNMITARRSFAHSVLFIAIHHSDAKFNQSEKNILELMSMGHENQEISDILCMSINTVASYRQRMHIKLGSRNAVESIEFAKALKII